MTTFHLYLLCAFIATWNLASASVRSCPDGWSLFSSSCYSYSSNRVSWASAITACTGAGGYLAEMRIYFFKSSTSSFDTWIGLTDEASEGTFVLASSGNAPAYSNWKAGEPNDSNWGEDCTIFYPDEWWNDAVCGNSNNYVCERAADVLTCPDTADWEIFGGKCYSFSTSAASWDSAKTACTGLGGYLAEIDNAEENAFMVTLRNGFSGSPTFDTWFGLIDQATGGSFVLASSGNTPSYLNWKAGEPNDVNWREDCTIYYPEGVWNDAVCGNTNNYVCEREAIVLTCPNTADWEIFDENCYSFSTSAASWESAKTVCTGLGGNLAEIDNAEENAFMVTLRNGFSGSPTFDTWFGLIDQATEGSFVLASSGKTPSYLNWKAGEPNDSNWGEDCTIYYPEGVWNDAVCGNTNNYVCERAADRSE